MFTKILIANRGEIAVRIMATCREMGIRTVAVYSEADRHAQHVREADEAIFIESVGADLSRPSSVGADLSRPGAGGMDLSRPAYLHIEAIIDAARQSGSQAIHPGYGFLSENTAFVEACEQANIVFIGPPAPAMRLMGSKIAAKHLAVSVNAPVIPGYNGDSQDDTVLQAEARRIGFPLLIKASAGGGGKGMREVHVATDFQEQLAGARREALSSFGDGTVFLERLIQQPRHVEIQILGDTFGNLIHLGERECSIQRRHQKIVEESPSIALTPALRAEMGAAAVRIAKAAGYVNAGTIEFILDKDRRFYFLEMNTRLQVEHPVTELVTGIDLVRHQLLIAAGQPLALTQEQISPRGHAIEMRLYAEDPTQNFLPSTGIITRFIKPAGPGIRVDSGVESGDEITQFYDPMIAKIIVYGEDRPSAIARMQHALEQSAVFGVQTNTPLLYSIATHPAFQEGDTHTSFLVEHHLTGESLSPQSVPLPDDVLIIAALYDLTSASSKTHPATNGSSSPWKTLGPWRMIGETLQAIYTEQENIWHVAIKPVSGETAIWNVQINHQSDKNLVEHPAEDVRCIFGNDDLAILQHGVSQIRAYVQHAENATQVIMHGQSYRLQRRQPPNVDTASRGSDTSHTQKALTAPMAGTIVKVQVRDGDTVQQRQVLVILSAMKMEHTIAAPYPGKIKRVYYQEGAVVKGGATLVEME